MAFLNMAIAMFVVALAWMLVVHLFKCYIFKFSLTIFVPCDHLDANGSISIISTLFSSNLLLALNIMKHLYLMGGIVNFCDFVCISSQHGTSLSTS
jgi:hypothetical protein